MTKQQNFVFTAKSRVNGKSSEEWVPVYGKQVLIESHALNYGWDVRGQHGSRWYAKGNQLIYAEFGPKGNITSASYGPRAARMDEIAKVEGKDKAGQILALMEGQA